MRQITYFAGHELQFGLHGRPDRREYALMEQFGFLNNPQRSINYIDHSFDDNVSTGCLPNLPGKTST
jgi:hypothetical protein